MVNLAQNLRHTPQQIIDMTIGTEGGTSEMTIEIIGKPHTKPETSTLPGAGVEASGVWFHTEYGCALLLFWTGHTQVLIDNADVTLTVAG